MGLGRQCIRLQGAGGGRYNALKLHSVKLEVDRLGDGSIGRVREVDRSSERIGVPVRESALEADIHDLNSPGLNSHGTAFIRYRQDQLLCAYAAVLRKVEGIHALHKGPGSNGSRTKFPCIGSVNKLTIRVGRRIIDLDLHLIGRCAD